MEALVLAASVWSRLGQSVWFAVIAVAAALFLLASLVFGHDHDADHDADHDTDHDADHDGSGGMSFFSFKVLLMFATGFGVGGYFASRFDWSVGAAAAAGMGLGLVMAAGGYAFLNALYTRQGSSTVQTSGLVGETGVVDVTIDTDKPGRVACTLPSGRQIFSAYSATGALIPVGTAVRVTGVLGSDLQVEPLSRSDSPKETSR
jgi:membrane protein implicated in regulation of membrane protease activity